MCVHLYVLCICIDMGIYVHMFMYLCMRRYVYMFMEIYTFSLLLLNNFENPDKNDTYWWIIPPKFWRDKYEFSEYNS